MNTGFAGNRGQTLYVGVLVFIIINSGGISNENGIRYDVHTDNLQIKPKRCRISCDTPICFC